MATSPSRFDDVGGEFDDIRVILAPQVDLTTADDPDTSCSVIEISSNSESDDYSEWSGFSSAAGEDNERRDIIDNASDDQPDPGDTSDDEAIPNPPSYCGPAKPDGGFRYALSVQEL